MNTTPEDATQIADLVDHATRTTPLLWPLGSAVAANPLWDLRDLSFPVALAEAGHALDTAGLPQPELFADAFRAGRITKADLEKALDEGTDLDGADPAGLPPFGSDGRVATILERHDAVGATNEAESVDREVAKYCAAYLAGTLPAETATGSGFFAAWRSVVGRDRSARRSSVATLAREMTGGPESAISAVLEQLGLDQPDAIAELAGQAARMPGWAAHAKWRSKWAAPDHPGPTLHLVDYLAVRLVYDLAALVMLGHRPGSGCCEKVRLARRRPAGVPAPEVVGGQVGTLLAELGDRKAGLTWLTAYEGHYRDRLLTDLDRLEDAPATDAPSGQLVFCIDARSEGLRRHLEALGGYETFGFAGFFGVPARVWPLASDGPVDLLPVLLRPSVEVTERVADGDRAEQAVADLQQLAMARRVVDGGRKAPVASYLLAEAGGLGLGPLALLRTAAPRSFARLRQRALGLLATDPEAVPAMEGPGAPSDAEQALYAESSLRAMGLVRGFAPVVVLCGHGSTTENNPYGSALDCGACGAARGAASARMAAAMYNRAPVRALLAERGIIIPDETVFVAAEHDTATDTVTLFVPDGLDPATRDRLTRIGADLTTAGKALAAERALSLPGASTRASKRHPDGHVATRSADWAQVQPEWGLARCAAFVVGPRRLTTGTDLQRRVFLHSYEPGLDPDGASLESILSGPMVVAQWISASYYHSTVDPDVLGAGDKVAHNVVAGVGVYQGAAGDLKLGLPRQSVFDNDGNYHEPMRLLVVVAAPLGRIDGVIARSPVVAQLVEGGWVHLAARDGDRFWLRRPGGEWAPWQPAAATTP